MQKNNCLYLFILLSLSISCRKIHYIPVRRPVRPGREIFSRDPDDPLKCLREEKITCHMRRDHKVLKLPQRAVRRKRFRLRNIETTAAEMSIF